ncbi:hypothetical protein KBD59_04685 [Candidatus Gracilibacteria bacterium]|nr:hypothetical protein [Candidatus Gracilibacteria bacterium]
MTFILIVIGSFIILLIGRATARIHDETKELKTFLATSDNIKQNFERSLKVYTASTQLIIQHLAKLRPHDEESFIEFISKIEAIGQKLDIKIELQSLDSANTKAIGAMKTLDYRVLFNGTMQDLENVINEVQKLPYYVKVSEIRYLTPELARETDKADAQNINLRINLFIK